MPKKEKPRPRKRHDFWDEQAKVMHLSNLYRSDVLGSYRARSIIASRTHAELDDTTTPEPDAELEGSELSDAERRAAIARERLRRERRA